MYGLEHPLYLTTSPIKYVGKDGGGTGFFFNYKGESYLTTAKHVVANEGTSDKDLKGRIWLKEIPDKIRKNHYDVSLGINDESNWIVHDDPKIDVSVLPLSSVISDFGELPTVEDAMEKMPEENPKTNVSFSEGNFLSDRQNIENKVSILAYHGEIIDRMSQFPIRRSTQISSPYGYNFEGERCFITDSYMPSGTSGGPVIMDSEGSISWRGNPSEQSSPPLMNFYLLGIHTKSIISDLSKTPTDDLWNLSDIEMSALENQLNRSYYADIIPEIILNELAE